MSQLKESVLNQRLRIGGKFMHKPTSWAFFRAKKTSSSQAKVRDKWKWVWVVANKILVTNPKTRASGLNFGLQLTCLKNYKISSYHFIHHLETIVHYNIWWSYKTQRSMVSDLCWNRPGHQCLLAMMLIHWGFLQKSHQTFLPSRH